MTLRLAAMAAAIGYFTIIVMIMIILDADTLALL